MTENEEKILRAIEDRRSKEDWEIEQYPWADDWAGDSPSITEITLYTMEKRVTGESDFFDRTIPDIYLDAMEVKIKQIMQEIVKEISLTITEEWDPDAKDRVASVLGDHADIFLHDTPFRFSVKTFQEAKEIRGTIEYLQDRYGENMLIVTKQLFILKHRNGTQRAGNTPKAQELKDGIKEVCEARITIKDKQRKEKIINKIIKIVTA